MMSLFYLMVLIQILTFKITLNLSSKKYKTLAENGALKIYPNEIKNRISFIIKTIYKLELISPEAIKLLGIQKKIKTEKIYQN